MYFYYTIKEVLLMTTKYLKKIGVLSLGKISGVLYGIMGLMAGAMITLMSLLMGSTMGAAGLGAVLFGVGAIIALPIFYGVVGFISGIIAALIFNVATGYIGGLEIEVE